MARITDVSAIRACLNQDRAWSVYALGDLLPEAFAKSIWFGPDLTLVYSDYGTCILFAMGTSSLREALEHASWPVHLQVRPEALSALEPLAVVTKRMPMWRMGWSGDRTGFVDTPAARRLNASDVPALEELYGDGAATGESPDFFFPSMVEAGIFYGVFDGARLAAAAGTHLYAPQEGAAAIGNVYTRRSARGRGLGKQVTCAVLKDLAGLQTVGLNVRDGNIAAIKVYESLGFRKHCDFFEALAVRAR